MTTEQYWSIALDYILNAPDSTNVNFLPKINGIPYDFVNSTINDLDVKKFISIFNGGGIAVTEPGKHYLEHHKLGLETISKDASNINIHNTNIGDGNTFNQSFNEGDLKNPINIPINTPTKKTAKYPIIKSILYIVASVIAIIIGWLITKK